MKLRLSDGSVIQVQDGLTKMEYRALLRKERPDLYAPSDSVLDVIGDAFQRSGIQIKGAFGDVLPALGNKLMGDQAGYERQMDEFAQKLDRIDAVAPRRFDSYQDVDGLGEGFLYGLEAIGEAGTQLGVTLGAGLAGGVIAGPPGALAGAGLTSAIMNSPEVLNAVTDPRTGEIDFGTGALALGAVTALDVVGVGRVAGPALKKMILGTALDKVAEETGNPLLKRAAVGFMRGSLAEAPTEGAQQAITIAAQNFVQKNGDLFTADNLTQVLDASLRGGLGGGVVGAGIDATFGKSPDNPLDKNRELEARFNSALQGPGEQMKVIQELQAELDRYDAGRQEMAQQTGLGLMGYQAQFDPARMKAEYEGRQFVPRAMEATPTGRLEELANQQRDKAKRVNTGGERAQMVEDFFRRYDPAAVRQQYLRENMPAPVEPYVNPMVAAVQENQRILNEMRETTRRKDAAISAKAAEKTRAQEIVEAAQNATRVEAEPPVAAVQPLPSIKDSIIPVSALSNADKTFLATKGIVVDGKKQVSLAKIAQAIGDDSAAELVKRVGYAKKGTKFSVALDQPATVEEVGELARDGELNDLSRENLQEALDHLKSDYSAKVEKLKTDYLEPVAKAHGDVGRQWADSLAEAISSGKFSNAKLARAYATSHLLKMLPKGANYGFRFEQKITPENQEAFEASGGKKGAEVQGAFSALPEGPLKGLFRISLSDNINDSLNETTSHEFFHAMQDYFENYDPKSYRVLKSEFGEPNAKITAEKLSPQMQRMLKSVKDEKGMTAFDKMKARGELSGKEAQAYAYGAYAQALLSGQKVGLMKPGLRKFFNYISDFRKRASNWAKGNSFQTAEDIFGKVSEGKTKLDNKPTPKVSDSQLAVDTYLKPARTVFSKKTGRGIEVPDKPVKIAFNPTDSEVRMLLRESDNDLRGFEYPPGQVHIWKSNDAIHAEVAPILEIPYDPAEDFVDNLTGKSFYITSLDQWNRRKAQRRAEDDNAERTVTEGKADDQASPGEEPRAEASSQPAEAGPEASAVARSQYSISSEVAPALPSSDAENMDRARKAIDKAISLRPTGGDTTYAAYRPDLGWIGVLWGDERYGLDHVMQQRVKQRVDGLRFLRDVPELLVKGELHDPYTRKDFLRRNITYGGNTAMLQAFHDGKGNIHWMMGTAFPGEQAMPQAQTLSPKQLVMIQRIHDRRKSAVGASSEAVGPSGRATQRVLQPVRVSGLSNFTGSDSAGNIVKGPDKGKPTQFSVSAFSAAHPDLAEPYFGAASFVRDDVLKGAFGKYKPVTGYTWGWLDDLITAFQNHFRPIEKLKNVVEKTRGAALLDNANPIQAEVLFHGRTGTRLKEAQKTLFKPILQLLKEKGMDWGDFDQYLYAKHARERNTYLRSRGSKVADPSGMSDELADSIIKRLETPDFKRAANMVYDLIKKTNQVRLDAGLISADLLSPREGFPNYKFYVPLRGWAEAPEVDEVEEDHIARTGQGFSISGKEDKTAFGRRSMAGDILAHTFMQHSEAIIRGEKNRVGQAFLKMVEDNPIPGIRINTPEHKPYVSKNGTIKYRWQMPSVWDQNRTFTVKVNGKARLLEFDDPRLGQALNNTGRENLNAVFRAFNKFNRYLAAINTAWSPEFVISNFARDIQTALLNLSQYDIENIRKNTLKGVPSAFRAISKKEGAQFFAPVSRNASEEWMRYYQDFLEDGGSTEFLGLTSLDEIKGEMENMIEHHNGSAGKLKDARQIIGKLGSFLERHNMVVENATRLSAYVAMRKSGATREKSAEIAKELTVNFNRKGTYGPLMNSMYLFYNAAVQGNAAIIKAMVKSKKMRAMAGTVFIAGAMNDIMNRMFAGEDDKGENLWDKLPDHIKNRNFVLVNPNTGEPSFMFPMPYGFNAIWNAGRNVAAWGDGGKTGSDAMQNIVVTTLDAFNPLGQGTVLSLVSPTISDPLVELYTNQDWTGRPIAPEKSSFGPPKPDAYNFWNSTGPISKWVADKLNKWSGGTDARSGLADFSPETINYWLDYAMGSAGALVTRTVGLADKIVSGEVPEIERRDIPFVRKLFTSIPKNVDQITYNEFRDDVMLAKVAVDQARDENDPVKVQQLYKEERNKLALVSYFQRVDRRLSDMRQQIKNIDYNRAIPDTIKAERKKKIRENMDTLRMQAMKSYVKRIPEEERI